jgi:hypothetical protein
MGIYLWLGSRRAETVTAKSKKLIPYQFTLVSIVCATSFHLYYEVIGDTRLPLASCQKAKCDPIRTFVMPHTGRASLGSSRL